MTKRQITITIPEGFDDFTDKQLALELLQYLISRRYAMQLKIHSTHVPANVRALKSKR